MGRMEGGASITTKARAQHHTYARSWCSSPAPEVRAICNGAASPSAPAAYGSLRVAAGAPAALLRLEQLTREMPRKQRADDGGSGTSPSCKQYKSGLKHRSGAQQHVHSSGSGSQKKWKLVMRARQLFGESY